METAELKRKIESQAEENTRLYNIFQYRLHEDVMQPVIQQWRDGSAKIKAMHNELYEIEMKERKAIIPNKANKTHTNSYGEATRRYITCSTYERADKRMQKEILLFMGCN